MLLELKDIDKGFKVGEKKLFYALHNINTSFNKGEFVSILGPSGSGKSTMLNLIAGLDIPTSGELIIEGKSSKRFRKKDWDLYRKNNIGFIFQNFNLIEHLTALENVEIVMNLIGLSYFARQKRARELLKKVGLEKHLNHKPHELSGGQKQRVSIARALANDPDIILADEPTGSLDKRTGKQIMKLIKSIAKTKLVIMVTHNEKLAREYSSRILSIKDGEIQSDKQIKEVKTNKNKSTLRKKNSVMSFIEAFKLSMRNMKKKKGRVIITTIAGCIGIIGFTLITGLGNGANIYIDKQLNRFGTANVLVLRENTKEVDDNGKENIVLVKSEVNYDKILNNEFLKDKIANKRKHIPMESATVKLNDRKNQEKTANGNERIQIYGLAENKHLQFLEENVKGELPKEGNFDVIVNQATARSILKDLELDTDDTKEAISKKIILTFNIPNSDVKTEKEFTVSGIVSEIDIGLSTIYYNYNDVKAWLEDTRYQKESVYNILTKDSYVYELTLKDVNQSKEVSDYINAEENGGAGKMSIMGSTVQKEGFDANNVATIVKEIFAQLIMIVQIVISLFIIISLIVSSIMTSIVLYSSIVERKTEIGIIKAVGGRNKDVMRIFESEAILMGVLSGILGIVTSFILAPILEEIMFDVLNVRLPGIISIPISKVPFTQVTFPFATIISIILFSSLISFIAGYLPSKKATKMNVIDALRSE